jgi:hypothetical protein
MCIEINSIIGGEVPGSAALGNATIHIWVAV